jgi:regulator of protease activity HflC (stomatin/prohibitin superfamily)
MSTSTYQHADTLSPFNTESKQNEIKKIHAEVSTMRDKIIAIHEGSDKKRDISDTSDNDNEEEDEEEDEEDKKKDASVKSRGKIFCDEGSSNNKNRNVNKNICFCISAFIVAFVIIITVSESFHTIPYYQLGFVKDKYGVVDVDTIMESGLHFLPLTKEFVLFPATFQNVMFSKKDHSQLVVYSDTGLSFEVEVSFEYQLLKEKLKYMYTQYGKKYDVQIQNIAKSVIKDRATHYLPDQYVSMREIIENDFAVSVQNKVYDTVGVYVPITHFILLNIIFPRKLIDKSLESVVEIQVTQINLNQQSVNITIADTNVLLAQTNSVVNAINSLAEIQEKEIIANSESLMNNMISSARATGINNTINYLNITNPIYIKKFMDIIALMESTNYSLFFGQMNPLIQIAK